MAQALLRLWYEELLPVCPYHDCILDAFVDQDAAYLIEVLHQCTLVLRYVSHQRTIVSMIWKQKRYYASLYMSDKEPVEEKTRFKSIAIVSLLEGQGGAFVSV
eukprot:1737206-Amphidinium_carterae.1